MLKLRKFTLTEKIYRQMNYLVISSERPNSQKRGSAEPERFGHFDRRFGRTVRPNLSHLWPNFWSKIDQHIAYS